MNGYWKYMDSGTFLLCTNGYRDGIAAVKPDGNTYRILSPNDSPISLFAKAKSTNQEAVKRETEQIVLSTLLDKMAKHPNESTQIKNLILRIQHMEKETVIPKIEKRAWTKKNLSDDMLFHVMDLYECPPVTLEIIRNACYSQIIDAPLPITDMQDFVCQLQQFGIDTDSDDFYAPSIILAMAAYLKDTLKRSEIQNYSERISFDVITDAMFQCGIVYDICLTRSWVGEYLLYGEKEFFQTYDESGLPSSDIANIAQAMKMMDTHK